MNIDDLKNIKHGKEECNHNYNDTSNTLIGVPKMKMVTPTIYYLKCKICGEVLSVSRNEVYDIKEFIRAFF